MRSRPIPPALRPAEKVLLQKLLFGQLPVAEVERLAAEYADDARLAELGESLSGRDDTLITSLRALDTVADPATSG